VIGARCRWWHSAVAAVALLCAAATGVAQRPPEGLAECLVLLEQQRSAAAPEAERGDAGVANPLRLGEICPELAAAIDNGAWGDALADGSAADLTTSAFLELAQIVTRYEVPPETQPLATDSLDDVLAALELREPVEEFTLWQRIQKWLDERLAARNGRAGRWLEDWLGNLSVPERALRYLVIALGAVLVIATVAVIANELRIAGVFAGGVLRKYSPLAARAAAGDERVLDFDDVALAPLARRPGLLLRLVLDRMRARGQAPLRDSLTHRELVATAVGLTADQGEALRMVASAAERATFGGSQPEEGDVARVLERGRTLVASLADVRAEQ
jgi:hypothetical protein